MSRLQMLQGWIATVVLGAGLTILPAVAADTQTFTGKISDTTCGAQHNEGPDPATCVRVCVKRGAKYALLVGDKVYALNTDDQATLDKLNKLAWEKAKVTGTPHGNAIAVESVTAVK